MTVARIDIPEAQIGELCRRNGIRRLALFGSVLTGRFSETSDVDVLVEFRPEERVGFFRLADIEDELSRLLGGRKVDLRTPMDLSRYFRDEVVRDAWSSMPNPDAIRMRHMREAAVTALEMAAGRTRSSNTAQAVLLGRMESGRE